MQFLSIYSSPQSFIIFLMNFYAEAYLVEVH